MEKLLYSPIPPRIYGPQQSPNGTYSSFLIYKKELIKLCQISDRDWLEL